MSHPSANSRSESPVPPIVGPTPDLPTHSEDGVDLTLIREFLSLTPAECLRSLQAWIDGIERVRGGRD